MPKFADGDLVKFKAKVVRSQRARRHKDRVFTITSVEWKRESTDPDTGLSNYEWLYKAICWDAPDQVMNLWEWDITRVKVPR